MQERFARAKAIQQANPMGTSAAVVVRKWLPASRRLPPKAMPARTARNQIRGRTPRQTTHTKSEYNQKEPQFRRSTMSIQSRSRSHGPRLTKH